MAFWLFLDDILHTFLMFRPVFVVIGVILWKLRYILLVLIASLIAYLTWDYQSREAVRRHEQQSWVEILHSPDYAPLKLRFSDDKVNPVLDPLGAQRAAIRQQYQEYLQKKASR
jgi:hypothetical protein